MHRIAPLFILLLSAVIVCRGGTLGLYPLFDPTEGRYAEIGRKMLETHNWVTPFIEYGVPFWGKPPLSFWLTALSYHFVGVNVWAARLPSFIISLLIAFLTWLVAKKTFDVFTAFYALCMLLSSCLFFYIAGGVMTDPILELGVMLSLVSFWYCITGTRVTFSLRCLGIAFFIGIAIALLAKGPIGLILIGMPITLWVVLHRQWQAVRHNFPWIVGSIVVLALVVPWYCLAEIHTPGFLRYFFIGEHWQRFLVKGWKGDLYGSGRPQPVGTIWLFAFLSTLPWSLTIPCLIPVAARIKQERLYPIPPSSQQRLAIRYWLLVACTPLLFFSLARNILMTYTLTSLPALAILGANYWHHYLRRYNKVFIATTALVPSLSLVVIGAILLYPEAAVLKSQAYTVQQYHRYLDTNPAYTGPLVYLYERPYSAMFYTQGTAVLLEHPEKELSPWLHKHPKSIIAVPSAYFSDTFKEVLEAISLQNKMVLLRKKK